MVFTRAIFDVDGTLALTLEHTMFVFRDLAEKMGQVLDSVLLQELLGNGEGWTNCCLQLFPGHSVNEFLEYAQKYPEVSGSYYLAQPVPGMPELLLELRKDFGVRIVCATNRLREHGLDTILANAGIEVGKHIERIIMPERGMRLKPSPDLLYQAMDSLEIRKNRKRDFQKCLVVEDTCFGIQAAKNSGLAVCAVLWGYGTLEQLKKSKPDFIADNVEDLRTIILGR